MRRSCAPFRHARGFTLVEAVIALVVLAAAGLAFLRDDLDGDNAFDEDPQARASFGLFPGSPAQIYREEVLR